jgi:acetyl coenzyme A synthetase (ADP forming)-like protein
MQHNLFDIQSIAVIGASKDTKKLGYDVLSNILTYGFGGKVYPINLTEEEILGMRVYKSVGDITDPIDCAVIAIPAQGVTSVLQECVKKIIPLVIIISAGFKESGPEGAAMEQQIQDIIKNTNTRVIGPNCLGIIDSSIHLNASFAASFPTADPISFISQSGALGTAFLDWISENNLGIDRFISIGNKADIDENMLLESLQDDNVIACYLEDIADGRKLMELGYKHNTKRPVIVLKPGKTDAAIKAIASHTGALSAGHIPIATALKQSGYIEVDTIGLMFHLLKAFAWEPLPKDNKVVIVTNAGGPAVITTDLLATHGLAMAEITKQSERALREFLPREANYHNPIDVVGDALSDRYLHAMETVLAEDEVSAMIVLLTPQIMTEIEQTAKYIGQMKKFGKPIVASFIGGTLVDKALPLLAAEKIPTYHFPETAVDVLAALSTYAQYRKQHITQHSEKTTKSHSYKAHAQEILAFFAEAQKNHQEAFSPDVSDRIARMYGISTPDSFSAANVEEAISLASTHNLYPGVLKISSPNVLHKSDIGGIITDISDENQLRSAYESLERIITDKQIPLSTIQIQKFIEKGQYVIIGALRDQQFGTLLLFGQGGIYTQIFNDVSRRIAPVSPVEMKDMINETKIGAILHGVRGESPYDIEEIVKTMSAVQDLMHDFDFVTSIDINPLIAEHDYTYSVDVKILI